MEYFEGIITYSPKPKLRCVGRVTHNHYVQDDQIVSKTTFRVLKRKSQLSLTDMCIEYDDIASMDLPSLPEGLYEIKTIGSYGDYENIIIPYQESEDE